MDKPERIAQVLGTVSTGGVASCVFNFYKHLDHSKYQFDFYTYDDSPYDAEILAMGGRIFHYPKVFRVAESILFLRKAFKENGYRVVHVHLTTLSFVPLFAAKLAKVPRRVCHAHSTTHPEEGFKHYVKKGLRPMATWFATNLAGCSKLSIDWLYRKKADSAFLLHNAVDLSRFSVTEEDRVRSREKYGLVGLQTVGFIGRFEVQKNVCFLVRAFALYAKQNKNARLILVGDGSQAKDVNACIQAEGVQEQVLLLPEQRDVMEYYALFDVFALPSRFEGLPLVAVEAQTAGLPCLLSAYVTQEADVTGACTFLSIDGKGAEAAWAKKMEEAMVLPKEQRTDVLREKGYDIDLEAKSLQAYYDSL